MIFPFRIVKQVLDSEKEEVSSFKEDTKFIQDKQLSKRDDTSRHITKMSLLKQLVEAEAQETKANLQVLDHKPTYYIVVSLSIIIVISNTCGL